MVIDSDTHRINRNSAAAQNNFALIKLQKKNPGKFIKFGSNRLLLLNTDDVWLFKKQKKR